MLIRLERIPLGNRSIGYDNFSNLFGISIEIDRLFDEIYFSKDKRRVNREALAEHALIISISFVVSLVGRLSLGIDEFSRRVPRR